jgi:ABC-2 type transport system permease protein
MPIRWMKCFINWRVVQKEVIKFKKNVMKIFFSFIRKEFQHVWRDKRSLFILLSMPIMMMLIFGFALSNEVKNSKIAILCPSMDENSRILIDRLDQSAYFSVVKRLNAPAEIESFFQKSQGRLVVVFPEDFANQLAHDKKTNIQLIADASDPNAANIVVSYASAIIRDYQKELMGDVEMPYSIRIENRLLYNPQSISSFMFVPGVMTLILMLLGAMMTSISIVKEKELGTMEVLLVSPVRPIIVVLSKTIPYALLCFIDVIIILLMARFVLNMPIRGDIFLLLLESILFIFTTLSLGLLISNSVEQQQVAMFISLVGLLMPSLIFTGFMFPIENMPLPMQVISNIVPTKWYYKILMSIMVKGLGWQHVWKETLILMAMTILLLGMAIRKFKIRLA